MTAWNDVRYKQNPSVSPFEAALINPASVDLRLGNQLRRVHPLWARLSLATLHDMCDGKVLPYYAENLMSSAEVAAWGTVETFDTAWLMPGEFVLCSSLETVTVPDDAVALLFSLDAGKRLMQHIFIRLDSAPLQTYAQTGRYQGQQGPTPAREAVQP
jgi:deoxycytidine triphosphate deaminase